MRLQIKQNLRFKIQNLHICYERKASNKLGHPFSFGITLHYLELTVCQYFVLLELFLKSIEYFSQRQRQNFLSEFKVIHFLFTRFVYFKFKIINSKEI